MPLCDDAGGALSNKKIAVVNVGALEDRCSECVRTRISQFRWKYAPVKSYTEIDEENNICLHYRVGKRLLENHVVEDVGDNSVSRPSIVRLSDDLYASASTGDDISYGVLKRTDCMTRCMTCKSKVTSCKHCQAYTTNAEEYGCDPNLREYEEDTFEVKSKIPIDYPWPQLSDDGITWASYYRGLKYPDFLVPKHSESNLCEHGHQYDPADPVLNNWIRKRRVKLWHYAFKTSHISYYRPSVGACDCTQEYDGRWNHILNVDGNNMVCYSLLFLILLSSKNTRFPLRCCESIIKDLRMDLGSVDPAIPYTILRLSYNGFIRLLGGPNWDYAQLYTCEKCGPDVECVVMDGIMMGNRKDLTPDLPKPKKPTGKIREVPLSDRVYIDKPHVRTKLGAYACIVRGNKRYGATVKPLSLKDFDELLKCLEEWPLMSAVVKDAGRKCPEKLRMLLGEMAIGSSVCGIIQIQGDDFAKVRRVLLKGAMERSLKEIRYVEKRCPALIKALQCQDVAQDKLWALIADYVAYALRPYERDVPSDDLYAEPAEVHSHLEYYPNHPLIRGIGNYSADGKSADEGDNELGNCRKDISKHKVLNPGLFTMFCPHGICLGFQLMSSPESPRTAFDILVRRFRTLPKIIVYDNACHLHLYCLKREPARFKNTRFFVDRLHYKNHVGCSIGYDMTQYDASDNYIKGINSQVNEQANAGLRRLSTQLTYMKSHNAKKHVQIFLAQQNLAKKRLHGMFTLQDCAPKFLD